MNCIKIIDTITGSAIGQYFDDEAQERAEQSLIALNEFTYEEFGQKNRYKLEVDLRTVQPKAKPIKYTQLVSYTVVFEVPELMPEKSAQLAAEYVESHLQYLKATVHNIAAEAGKISQHIVTVRVEE